MKKKLIKMWRHIPPWVRWIVGGVIVYAFVMNWFMAYISDGQMQRIWDIPGVRDDYVHPLYYG